MAKKKKEKGNWVSRLKAGVKYHLSGEASKDLGKQVMREEKLKRVKTKLAKAKGEAAPAKKKKKKVKRTARTKKIESSSAKGDFKKMRGNY